MDGLQTGSYINRENQKVFTTEVVAEDVRFYALKPFSNGAASESPTQANSRRFRIT